MKNKRHQYLNYIFYNPVVKHYLFDLHVLLLSYEDSSLDLFISSNPWLMIIVKRSYISIACAS